MPALCPDCRRVAACSARKGVKEEPTRYGEVIRREKQIQHEEMIHREVASVIRKSDLISMIKHFTEYLEFRRKKLNNSELYIVKRFIKWMHLLNRLQYCEEHCITHIDRVYEIFLDYVIHDTDNKDSFKKILESVGHDISFENASDDSGSDPDLDDLYNDNDPRRNASKKSRQNAI
jgi:hypothetical protein